MDAKLTEFTKLSTNQKEAILANLYTIETKGTLLSARLNNLPGVLAANNSLAAKLNYEINFSALDEWLKVGDKGTGAELEKVSVINKRTGV